jgi:hypothetical protein
MSWRGRCRALGEDCGSAVTAMCRAVFRACNRCNSVGPVPSLTRIDAQRRADLVAVAGYDVRLGHHGALHRCRPGGIDIPRRQSPRAAQCRAQRPGCGPRWRVARRGRPAGAERPRQRERTDRGRGDGVLARRRGPAPPRRSRRRTRLPLRDVVPRRRAALVRVLRPARSQGAGDAVAHLPAGLAGRRQRRRDAGRAGTLGVRHHAATGDLLHHARRRALPPRQRHPRRHPARPARAGLTRPIPRSRRRGVARDHPGLPRRVPPAVRDPLPVGRVPPGLRTRVQCRRDGEPGLRHAP